MKSTEVHPSIAGVPEEVQKNIVEDIKKEKDDVIPASKTLKIGVSISDNEDLAGLGYGQVHLKDLMIEVVRSLLINDIITVYGGDLRKEGYTHIFTDLAYQYRSIHESKKQYFLNYFAYPIFYNLTRSNELDFKKNRTQIFKVPPPQDLGELIQKYLIPDSLLSMYIWARSLTEMREKMISQTDGRILVGGKLNHYAGKMPGVIEEAKIALQLDKPVYLVGCFGGSTKEVANALSGGKFQFETDSFHTGQRYLDFKGYYNERQSDSPIDLASDAAFFANYGLEKLAKSNGLTVEENLRLFVTPHLNEILYFIFKGISKLRSA